MTFTLLLFTSFACFILGAFITDISIFNKKYHNISYPYYFIITVNFIGMTLFILSFVIGV